MFNPTIFACFAPDIILLYGIVSFIILIVLLNYFPSLNSKSFALTVHNLLVFCLAMAFAAIITGEGSWVHHGPFYPTELLVTAPLVTLSKLVLLALTILCVWLHSPIITQRVRLSLEYSILILLITEASLVLLSANDLSLIFLAMELQTLSLVAFSFVGHATPQAVIVEAIVRYFFNTAYASVSFLFGLSLLYALVGSLHLEHLPVFLATLSLQGDPVIYLLLMVAVVLLFYTIFFKLTLAPFHQWVGDLYQGTSGYVGSYFSLVTKIPMLVVLYKLLFAFGHSGLAPFFWTLPIIGLLSVAVGNIYAFHQPNFRRFWAVASISHMGQILLAFTCFTPESSFVAFLYLFSYLTGNIFVWAVLLHQTGRPSMETGYREFFQKTFRLLSLNDRRLAWLTLFIFASLAGVPPTFGFVGKFYLFLQLYTTHNYLILAILFFLNLISLTNYIRLIRFLFFENPVTETHVTAIKEKQLIPLSVGMYGILALIFLFHVFFGLWSLVLLVSLLISLF